MPRTCRDCRLSDLGSIRAVVGFTQMAEVSVKKYYCCPWGT